MNVTSSHAPPLVVLAAGLGSRFGGAKQLAAVGPSGEFILDYTMVDARRAGFGEVVLIIRHDITRLVEDHLRSVHGDAIPYRLVFQDDLGPARAKPWGTGHAVLAARDAINGPFGVVNADDFYGAEALQTLARALGTDAPPGQTDPTDPTDPTGPNGRAGRAGRAGTASQARPVQRHHLIAYRLDQTLSLAGPVSRGVCHANGAALVNIREHHGIMAGADGRIRDAGPDGRPGTGDELAPDSPVSMNLWGLQPTALDELAAVWESFPAEAEANAELQLPTVLDASVQAGRAAIQVTRTAAAWMGVTYPEDLGEVQARLAALVAQGRYRSPLSSGTPAG